MPQPESDERLYPDPAYAWYALGIVCVAYVFGFIDRIIVGLLTPAIQADLGLTDSQAGIIQGLAFALYHLSLFISLRKDDLFLLVRIGPDL